MTADVTPDQTTTPDRRGRLAFLGRRQRALVLRVLRPAPYGTLLRRRAVSVEWGFDRGTPVDRHFIEGFLSANRDAIHGRVLEVKDDTYTRRYGSDVEVADVLDIDAGNALATVVADLADAPHVPDDGYDCIVLTQTLHLVYDLQDAIRTCHRILKPGGTLLATMPSASRCSRELLDTDFWRVTPAAGRRLFGDVFGAGQVEVDYSGNAILTSAFLLGVSVEEVPKGRLEHRDPLWPMLVTVRATKAAPTPAGG